MPDSLLSLFVVSFCMTSQSPISFPVPFPFLSLNGTASLFPSFPVLVPFLFGFYPLPSPQAATRLHPSLAAAGLPCRRPPVVPPPAAVVVVVASPVLHSPSLLMCFPPQTSIHLFNLFRCFSSSVAIDHVCCCRNRRHHPSPGSVLR